MAGNFPVMCSNDEFHLFPRVEEAHLYLDRLDNLNSQKITQSLSRVRGLLSSLEKSRPSICDLDTEIDFRLLSQSMRTFLREFGRLKTWQMDPAMYIKIYLLGIDELLSKIKLSGTERLDAVVSRIRKGGDLLEDARRNLKKIPQLHKATALELITASVDYLKKRPYGFS